MSEKIITFYTMLILLLVSSGVFAGPGLRFIENKNQWDAHVDYGAQVPGGQMFLAGNSFRYILKDKHKLDRLHQQSHQGINEATGAGVIDAHVNAHYITMTWMNALAVKPAPFGRSSVYHNYFLGKDERRWGVNAHEYEGVLYQEIYPDIDLKVYSSGQNLKYDFIVQPGGDANQIVGSYEGADKLYLDENGNLYCTTTVGELIEKRPYAYQFINGKKKSVECRFHLEGNTLSFSFPNGYDACEQLVIDPLLIFSTYSGSTADNWGSTATPGENGTLYSAGVTTSSLGGVFPATAGAFQEAEGGEYDVGILKYDSTGQNLLYASYLGGTSNESPHSLVLAANGDLLILGTTSSSDFPITNNAYDKSFHDGVPTFNVINYDNGSDIFVARISGDGTQLLASTFLGGSDNDGLNPSDGPLTLNYGDELRGDVITSDDGSIFVSTVTSSPDFFLENSFSTTYHGGESDALLLKLSSDLSTLLWGAFIGGSATDNSHTIKLDANGDIFVAGGTTSTDFTTTTGSYKRTLGGVADGWIAKVKGDGSALMSATYTGTPSVDQNYFIALNSDEEVFVYGQTDASSFPITSGVYSNPGSGQFLQKYSNDLSMLMLSTVFGSGSGTPNISPTAFLVNDCNNIYMTGWGGILNIETSLSHWDTNTQGMPTTYDAFQKTTSGNDFYFIVLTADASELVYGTYMGGPSSLTHVDGGTSRFDKHGIVYHAVCSGCRSGNGTGQSSSDFPTTPNAWSRVNRSYNCNNAAFKFDLASLKARLASPVNTLCVGDTAKFKNTSTGGELFYWDFGDGAKIVTQDPSAQQHVYQARGNYTVWLKVVDEGTCTSVDSTKIDLAIGDHVAQVQPDDELCEGDRYTLKASNGATYHWTDANGFSSFAQNPMVDPKVNTEYYVTIEEPFGCILKDTVALRVVTGIQPVFTFRKSDFCFGNTLVHVVDSTQDADDAQLIFNFGDGTTSERSEDTHHYENSGVYTVRLTAIREFCVFEKEKQIPIANLKIPNVFTPEASEGFNDTFTIQADERLDVLPRDYDQVVSIRIYNRWGEDVYASDDYRNDWSGAGLASGVYYYEIKIQDETCKSWVHVLK